MEVTEEKIKEKLAKELSKKDFSHSIRVMKTAEKLAFKNGVNKEKARIAGLLHDCARNTSLNDLLKEAKESGVKINSTEKNNPYLLHAVIGAKFAKETYGVSDKEILDAIASHTLGRVEMNSLQKLIYIADMIESERKFEGVEMIRKEAQNNLNKAFLKALSHTIKYVIDKRRELHPETVKVWNSLVQELINESAV